MINIKKTNKLSIYTALFMLASLFFSSLLVPKKLLTPIQPDLNKQIPTSFGDWKEVKSNSVQVGLTTNTDEQTKDMDNPYDQVLMRTYENSKGQRVMLALAWGQRQQQEVKIHRPELCYAAQGFTISSVKPYDFGLTSLSNKSVVGKQMIANHGQFREAVSYWIRIGNYYSEGAFLTRLNILQGGLSGEIYDGILVRVSTVINSDEDLSASFELNSNLISELVKNSTYEIQKLLLF